MVACWHQQASSRPELFVSRKIGESECKLDEIMRVVEEESSARERTTAIAVNSIKKHTREPPHSCSIVYQRC